MTVRNSIAGNANLFESSDYSVLDSPVSNEIIGSNNYLISIVIPLYNEENSIKALLESFPNHYRYEIIIVDDGSTDKSIQKIKEVDNLDIEVIQHDRNLGYGAAIKSGFDHAKGDIIVTMDSDGQHDPKEIPNLVKPLISNKADLIVGSRYLGKCRYKIPLHTRAGEFFIKTSLWFLYNQKVYNNQNGFRAFKKESLDIFRNLRSNGMGFTTELLFESAYSGLKIVEIPITVSSRRYGTSYIKLLSLTRFICSCVIIYTLRKFRLKKFALKVIEKFFF